MVASLRSLQIRQTLILIVLTIVYLCFELGFNARLLDVVGGDVNHQAVEDVEFYGRSLSGIAAALVVLQLMWRRRLRRDTTGPSWKKIVLCSVATALIVFMVLKTFVTVLVNTRDAEFRRLAFNTTLMQRSLVGGSLQLQGLVDDPTLFAQPEGKAFLALFPFLAVSVGHLDERMEPAKEQLINFNVRKVAGGAAGYYEKYQEAIKEVHERWKLYSGIIPDSDPGLQAKQQSSWSDYQQSLSRHGWRPESVPARRRAAVVNNVRKKVPVPANWHPADQLSFRLAVKRRYASEAASKGVTVKGDRIAPGLSFPAFVARPGIQAVLRDGPDGGDGGEASRGLRLPKSAVVQDAYASPAEFGRLFDQFAARQTQEKLLEYRASPVDFAGGGKYFAEGKEASRAAIVPPVALFFSLLGAIGHFSKLLYLIATVGLLVLAARRGEEAGKDGQLSRRSAWIATGVLATAFLGTWGIFTLSDNNVTRSELFRQMLDWNRQAEDGSTRWTIAGKALLANFTHVVAVGQGYSYPVNEAIRLNILQGMEYGYHPKEK
ncbi:hypothetical protein [Janthinobacterium psychrotolerans]|uniref:Uncharacterized protein n=1 Tax=Janthinobacterium psychrotolerans TaxID=1747903 RepID=A0A1A7BUT7_9BURK|nr:hypothetical protein [Janthinobacterium psychrotolerans]OBV37326.1 hypothetical protein ASR47_1002384 [Janthinobacterium psychrotolerans]